MWTDFSKKPLAKSVENQIPEAMPVPIETTRTTQSISKSSIPSATATISQSYQTEETQIIDIDVDYIVKQIQDVLKSPSPLTLYKKSTELKENFAQFINYLVKKISAGFNSQNKTIILSMYQNAKYEQVWLSHMKTYLEDSKYFDTLLYFRSVFAFQKNEQYLAKGLLQLFIWDTKENIDKFLSKYKSRYTYNNVKTMYDVLELSNLKWIIDQKFLNENNIGKFIEQIIIKMPESKEVLFQTFCLFTDEMKWKFDDTYSIFSNIARHYIKNISYKDRQVNMYLNYYRNRKTLDRIDEIIKHYFWNKSDFYKQISDIIFEKSRVERWFFWDYVKTQIINIYYPEIARLFYWDKKVCADRNEWSQLKWNFVFSEKSEHIWEIKEILSFKKLIIELDSNIFAPFLKPLIYSIVSEKLAITRKELLKIRFLMTLVLTENYKEYKKIYNFFEDLETFMDYNIDNNFDRFVFNFKKIKIFAADLILWIATLIWLFIYAPVGVFISCLILSVSYLKEHFGRFRSGIEWNLGIRTFATVLLVISWFYWITNLNTTKIDIAKLNSKVEKLWIYKTDVAFKIANDKIEKSWIKETVVNIFQYKDKK